MVQTVRWDPPSLHRFHRAFFLRTDNLQVAQGTLGHSRSTAPPAVHRLQLHHSKPHSLFQDGPEAGGHVVPCDDRPFVSTRQKKKNNNNTRPEDTLCSFLCWTPEQLYMSCHVYIV